MTRTSSPVGDVEFGIYVPQLALSWEAILERALSIEELGFDSMWIMDHLYPPGLPGVPSLEAWTLASALLTSTTTLRVGHMVGCNNFRHPALLAKMATSLDVISGGRLVVGLGSGSFSIEHDQAGLPWGSFAERTERLEEALEIVTRMFASDVTTFEGRHYSVRDLPNLPRPVQAPPPVLVGGSGSRTLELAARYADIWNCPTYALGKLDETVHGLRQACTLVGRDPSDIRLSMEAVLVLGATDDDAAAALAVAERRYGAGGFGLHEGGFIGTPDTLVAKLRAHVDRGITHFVFFTHDRGERDTLELLADKVVPRVVAG